MGYEQNQGTDGSHQPGRGAGDLSSSGRSSGPTGSGGLRVLAIDPGEKVGYAVGTITPNNLEVESHGIAHLREFALKLHETVGNYDVIVYESFRIYPAAAKHLVGSDVPTAQLIGMIRLLAWTNKVELVAQGANRKKVAEQTAPDWLLREIEKLPKTHDEAHDGDALLHLWQYYFAEHFDPTTEAN